MKDNTCFRKLTTELWYTVRRYYVDTFYLNNINLFKEGASILDMGGKKLNKRGEFDIGKYNLEVLYANIDEKTQPDFLCDIKSIPVADESFDGIILSEVLEHVDNPDEILKEAYRLLRPGGVILICTPFMFHVHADPYDYCRYTDYWYDTTLHKIGFNNIAIEKQGLFFAVLANMIKIWCYELEKVNRPKGKLKKWLLDKFAFFFAKRAFNWDESKLVKNNIALSSYTTGYGVICRK